MAGHPTGRPGHAVGYPQEMDEGYAMASVAGFPADFRIKARDKFGDDRPYGADFFYVDLTQLCESDEPGHRCRKDAEGEYAPVYFWRESMDLDQRFNPDLEDELASPGACPSAHHSPRTLNWTGACPLVNSSAVLGALCSSASCKIETTGGTLCHQPSILVSLSIGRPNPHDGRHTTHGPCLITTLHPSPCAPPLSTYHSWPLAPGYSSRITHHPSRATLSRSAARPARPLSSQHSLLKCGSALGRRVHRLAELLGLRCGYYKGRLPFRAAAPRPIEILHART